MKDEFECIPTPDGGGGFMPIDQDAARALLGIENQATGAIPNGRRIRKITFKSGDRTPIGELGTVLSSLGPLPMIIDGEVYNYMYTVRWDRDPEHIVGIVDASIEEVE